MTHDPATATPAPAPSATPSARRVPRGFFLAGEILAAPGLTSAEKMLLGLMAALSRESGHAFASVDTYAARLGLDPRTVRRLLARLTKRGLAVCERRAGGRGITGVYCLDLSGLGVGGQVARLSAENRPVKGGRKAGQSARVSAEDRRAEGDRKAGQPARVSKRQNPDKTGRKPGQVVRRNVDKTGQKPGQIAPQVKEDEGRRNRGEEERPPAPLTCAPGNNGNGGLQEQQNPDAALVALAEAVRGRPFTAPHRAAFVQAVAEARAKGATDEGIASGIKEAGPNAAPWDGPNLARDAAPAKLNELLDSYQRAAKMLRRRNTLAEIAADVGYARKCMAQTPQPSAGDDAAALWQAQIAWADAHPEALPAEARRPELATAGVPA